MADSLDSSLWYGYDVNAEKTGNSSVNAVSRTPSNELDKDAFLKLLLTQLQYQDPLNPVEDKEFIAQMSQLTMAEQMKNMAASFAHNQAYNLIGKSIYAEILDDATGLYTEVSGEVSSVLISGGEAFVMVGSTKVPLNKIQFVYSDHLAQGVNSLAANTVTTQALALLGKHVQAVTFDSDYNMTGYVEGKVEDIKFDANGNPMLVVNNKEVYVKEVITVSEGMRLIGSEISAALTSGTVQGTITDVEIEDDMTYLIVDGQRVYMKSLALTTDALKYIGQEVDYLGISGTVTSVIMRSGIPSLVVGEIPATDDSPGSSGVEINFADFKGVDLDA